MEAKSTRVDSAAATTVVLDGKATRANRKAVGMVREMMVKHNWPSLLFSARQLITMGYHVARQRKGPNE